jgi:hypothetical protein
MVRVQRRLGVLEGNDISEIQVFTENTPQAFVLCGARTLVGTVKRTETGIEVSYNQNVGMGT